MPTQETDLNTIEAEKQIIKKVAGLSSTNEIIFNDRGWDSRVYSFSSGRFFFKFPRSQKIQMRYKYEIEAIKLIKNIHTSITTQKILWEHPENVYFGYEGVQGMPLRKSIEKLNTSQKYLIGNILGNFLKHFHKLELEGARIMNLENETKQIQRWYENNINTVIKWFNDTEQKKLHQYVYKIWPARSLELGIEPVLSHGDLHFENILYRNNGTIGIIDFGDVGYYDRSIDFFELDEDKDIFNAALKEYGTDHPNFMQKVALRQAMVQVINLGFHVGKKDIVNIENTVNKIRQKL